MHDEVMGAELYAGLLRQRGRHGALASAVSGMTASVRLGISDWDDLPEDPDEGGAGVREPRRPLSPLGSVAVALDVPVAIAP